MTTDGSNGAPEGAGDDDPFGYLYRPADGSAAPSQPRSSYNRPMEVGRAQYGQQPAQAQQPYGAPQQSYGQAPYGQQQPGRQQSGAGTLPTAPLPQQSRYAERSRPQPGDERPGGGRGKGAVIGAVAVVAAVAIGIGIALSTGDPGGKAKTGAGARSSAPAAPSSAAPASPSAAASPSADTEPIADAGKLQAQNAPVASTVKGAVSADGSYLALQGGSTVTWTVVAPSAGQFKFWLHFNNTATDQPAQVTVNGKDHPGGVTFKNYSKGNTDPNRAWYSTNIWPQLQAGSNTLTVTLPAGSSGILLDQVALTDMSVSDYPKS
ncbi:carbohydrate-binding protein [Kitasatospora paranensis]|uniref:Carbohydrate-binding protein n=1 Tax=Kitasatospora paranensis TaxID=258053 RepID=A0ABW2FPL3_9ACTN